MPKMCRQGDDTADVVRDDVRPLKFPAFEQRRQCLGLHPEIDRMIGVGRAARARHAPQVDREIGRRRIRERSRSHDDHGVP